MAKTIKKVSSFNVITIIDGEMFIDGEPAGLPTIAELNEKQDTIYFLKLTAPSGILNENVLSLLNRVNRLVYNNVIYYPVLQTDASKLYCSKTEVDRLKEIVVYLDEQRYGMYDVLTVESAVIQHINDTTIHVTQADKDRWNNKVDASAVLIEDADYNLVLSKD